MSEVDAVFEVGGLFAKAWPGYKARPGQLRLAKAVEAAIESGDHLVAEGPTGVGKSLAYLVPSILDIQKDSSGTVKRRVIVVTANIALQEQLVEKDLPGLAKVLPRPFAFASIKGRNNYVCLSAREKVHSDALLHDPVMSRLLAWADSTQTGDVSELEQVPPPALWRKLAVGSDECKGSTCKFAAQCFANRARAKLERADVIVTNYHLFFAHLVVRRKMKEIRANGGDCELDVVLPPADVVVLDEAHKAADIAREFLGFTITRGQVDWVLRGLEDDVEKEVRREAHRLFDAALELRKSKRYRSRLKVGHGLDFEPLALALDRLGKHYAALLPTAASSDEMADMQSKLRRAGEIARNLRAAQKPEEDQETVYFLEETLGKVPGCAIRSKPIDVSEWLSEELFDEFDSVILTSATLATGSRNSRPFDFIRREVGLQGGVDLVVESPFDWARNAMLIVPRTVGDPKERETFPASVASHVRDVALAAGGRTLALFTSYKNLSAAHEACRDEGSRFPFRLFRQGDMPRTKLVAAFREDVSSCLFGTESFWAGVDVPGESLSCVVIDRLPFASPDDPIVDALAERSSRWFFEHAVPKAIIAVKQGAGRLIRTETDRGCVVILDRRIVEMSYGRAFLAALPSMRIADEVADVAKFLEGA